jgi:signal peptide peptidase SppA
MSFSRILSRVYHEPWFITAGGFQVIDRLIKSRLARSNGDDGEMDLSAFVNPREEMEIDSYGIAHIHICGTLAKGISEIEKCCGATDYEDVEDELQEAMKAGVRGIWLEIDSPGGACTGNSEVADMLQGISAKIPTLAWTDGMACSAAYNIACSAREIWASPSATLGSIGAIIPWVDQSAMWADEGLEWAPITNTEGDLKGAMSGPSLTAAQAASLQELVQDNFNLFKANVLRNRNVAPESMRGQCFLAGRALQNKLIDKVATEELAFARLVSLSV